MPRTSRAGAVAAPVAPRTAAGLALLLLALPACAAPAPGPFAPAEPEPPGRAVLAAAVASPVDPAVHELREILPALAAAARERAAARLGPLADRLPPWRLLVEEPPSSAEPGALLRLEADPGAEGGALVVLRPEALLEGEEALVGLLAHEAGHAWLLARPGPPLPGWAEEGAADWIGGAGDEARSRRTAAWLFAREFRPVPPAPHAPGDPSGIPVEAEAERGRALADAIEEASGTDGVRRWLARLLEGDDAMDAVEALLPGRGGEIAASAARAFEARVLAAGEEARWFRGARAAFSRERWVAAEYLYGRFLEDYAGSRLATAAGLERAAAILAQGRAAEALDEARALRDRCRAGRPRLALATLEAACLDAGGDAAGARRIRALHGPAARVALPDWVRLLEGGAR